MGEFMSWKNKPTNFALTALKDADQHVQKIVGEVAIAQTKKDTINQHLILGKVVAQPIEKYEPLYVLDGKVISTKAFKNINQKTIKSMEVVKGKKAIAIFGEKAKNGVIIIKTK